MNSQPASTNSSSAPAESAIKKSIAPAATALVGTSAIVLLVELARSGALEQYKELLAPLIGWGPGLLVLVGFLWLANNYGPPFIDSQRSTALSLQKLADTVERSAANQHDLVLAMQVNSDKLEQLRGSVADLEDHLRQLGCLDLRLSTRDSGIALRQAQGPEPSRGATRESGFTTPGMGLTRIPNSET